MERIPVDEEKLIEVIQRALRVPGLSPALLGGVERLPAPLGGCNWSAWWVQVRDAHTRDFLARLIAPLRAHYVLEPRQLDGSVCRTRPPGVPAGAARLKPALVPPA